MTRKTVLVFRRLPADQLARIGEHFDVHEANPLVEDERAHFFNKLPHAHGLIGSSYPIDANLISKAKHLEVVSSISAGLDNYDVEALKHRGIVLCSTADVLTETTADTLFMMILAASRRIVELALHVRDGHWKNNIDESLFGWDVHGKTLGVVGYGRIGKALARRAALGFRMPVLYHNRTPKPKDDLLEPALQVPLDFLLRESDIVALTLPLTNQTPGLMDESRFASMKKGAILVNGSRGAVVQEHALIKALNSGHLRAAALDVFEKEPLPLDSQLRVHPLVLALPHVGSATHEARRAMMHVATSNLIDALSAKKSGKS